VEDDPISVYSEILLELADMSILRQDGKQGLRFKNKVWYMYPGYNDAEMDGFTLAMEIKSWMTKFV